MLITNAAQLLNYQACHRVWQGLPGVVRTKGGRLFVCFYSGGIAEQNGNYALLLRSDDGENFGEPVAVAFKQGEFRCYDPVLWIDPLDRLWFFWGVMPGAEVMAAICDDPDADELCWSEEFYVGRGVMMNKPTVLSDGRWLFPIALWDPAICPTLPFGTLGKDDISAAFVYESCDEGKTITRQGGVAIPGRSFDEHMIVEQADGSLRMLVRLLHGIGESYSRDGGKTWEDGFVSDIKGPSSRFFIRRLRSGRILLVNHYDFKGRNNLTALLSEDDGKTFPYRLLLDERNAVSYPDAHENEDGYIDIVYDRERGAQLKSINEAYLQAREILLARITEQDILQGSLCSERSYLKRVASKLGRLSEQDGDPYAPPVTNQ